MSDLNPNLVKFWTAIKILKSDVEVTTRGEVLTEDDFNNLQWKTGTDENGVAITTNTCPHSEITFTKLKAEMDKL
tara:strand:+ start:380 stop:604 length:225 start_codon:yes stop_codon:yes gene_type:complete